MKKGLALILLSACILAVKPSSAIVLSGEYENSPFHYMLIVEDGDTAITSITDPSWMVNVPAQINGVPDTEIYDKTFYECDSITFIKLPEGFKRIRNYAF